MFYGLKVRWLKRPRVNKWWRRIRARRGEPVGNYADLPQYVRRFAPGRSFADIGCMWGVNGEYAFLAEASGASRVVGVDVFGPTPEFDERRETRGSSVEFVLGDVTKAETIAAIGRVDVVLCAGVLYHHPSPFDILVALRRICREILILRTSTIPEVPGLPNAAVFFPMLDGPSRNVWNLRSLGLLHQAGISAPFRAEDGYGNWFWGLSPSCLESMLRVAGFRVEHRATEPFAQTCICRAVRPPIEHQLPDERAARELGEDVSASGRARPA